MIELEATITELKGQAAANPSDKSLAARLADAIGEYDSLSALLGGDRVPSPEQPGGQDPAAPEAPGVAPAAPPGCTAATTTTTNSTPVAILDLATATSTIVIAGANPFLLDVDLTTNITHTFASDLDITLTSPVGTVVTLTTDNGGGNDNVFNGTVWDDDGGTANPPGPVTDNTFANLVVETPLVPEEAMGAFIGENPNGTWTLAIGDDAGMDTGNLSSWSLSITALTAAPTDAATTTTNSTPVAILDFMTATSNLAIAGAGTYLRDVNLTTNITHTFASDLDITITSPGGTVVTLTTDNGGGNDNVFNGTVWDDSGGTANPPGPVTDNTFANLVVETPLVPEEAMGAFIGENPNGTWTLSITDDLGGDVGSLNSWSLTITTSSCAGGACEIGCPVLVIQENDPNQCGAVVNYPAPTSSGTCGTITCSPASGSFFPVGTTTVTCTASAGPTCSFPVTVNDTQPPTITCPANVTVSNDPNQCGAVVNYPPPTITDNCPGAFTATCNPPSGSFFPVGTTTVSCTVDNGALQVGGPGDQATNVEPTAKAASSSGGQVKNGGTAKVPKKEAGEGSAGSGPAGPAAPFAVLYDQTGASNNGSPSQNFEVAIDAFDCQTADEFVVPAGQTWNVTQVNVGGSFSAGGGPPTSINVTFFNNSGSLPAATTVASFNNVVTFASAPNFNITLPATVPLTPGTYWVSVQVNMNFTPAGQWFWSNFGVSNIGSEYAWRNPGGGFLTPCTNFGAGSTGCGVGGGVNRNNIFTIIGTIAAPPIGGSTCTFTVTVNDTQPPTITCPPNVTAVTALTCPASNSTVVNFPPPTASDNCPGVTVQCTPPSGSVFPVGTTTVTCTATDASGNTATCSFTVTVFDVCLQDDSNPTTKLLINSFTGEYRFLCQGTIFTGVGKVLGLGCDKQLTHSPADRRVRANWTVPAKKGNAAIQSPPGTVRCTLGDSDMTDNDCATGLAENGGAQKPGKK